MNGPVRVDNWIIWSGGYHRQMTRMERWQWRRGRRVFSK